MRSVVGADRQDRVDHGRTVEVAPSLTTRSTERGSDEEDETADGPASDPDSRLRTRLGGLRFPLSPRARPPPGLLAGSNPILIRVTISSVESAAPNAPDALLEGLNDPQRDAVLHVHGPLLILAGAGSGKTAVLTRRIAHLVRSGQAQPGEILAITFTNKAAAEMRARVEQLVGRRARAMWVMTFHSACARMLRAEAEKLGYTRSFTIWDEADSVRLVKACIEELDVDPKRFSPRAVKRQISDAKNLLEDADAYRQKVGSFFEQTVADVYALYEQRAHAMNAMDFDDLLVRAVNVLELFPEVRERYRSAFRYVLVDEYQDTNRAQYRWLQLLTEESRNLCVVGDDDQCVVEGTPIRMADGSTKPVEDVRTGELVRSCYGSGDFRGARVTGVSRTRTKDGIAIRTVEGRQVVSTPEHMHFAGYRRQMTPPLYMTYLMWRRDKGFRVGTTRTSPEGRQRPVSGVQLRTLQEHADASWIVSTHVTDAESRAAEMKLAPERPRTCETRM